ncbi:hypothetical protein [Sulfobacillus thermosulfidooxidans]|uniref:hypothetical protein n=1 Tax=Sulfobacillus thermosulfidooxidans TaxID=28034 RepID=UPI0006B4C15F|nr:hypothetical protein [Sulfobacillus thermosulfidooxidans]
MNLINLTPHAIHFMANETTLTIEPCGTVARCAVTRHVTGYLTIQGVTIPVTRTQFGAVEGLPNPAPDTLYIVSALVAQACPDRDDLVIPDDTVRDDAGRIIGCRALAHV